MAVGVVIRVIVVVVIHSWFVGAVMKIGRVFGLRLLV